MIPSRETLERMQRRWDFRSDALEMILHLVNLLRGIHQDSFLESRLVLKGGTALNLCFGAVPRLSVDLDFNHIGALDRERAIEERPRIITAVEQLSRRSGYRVQRSRPAHAGQKLYLGYRSALGGERQVRIDLNFLFRQPIEPAQDCAVWSPEEGAPARCRVVGHSELIAGKLLALLDRAAPRDLYDVARLRARGGPFKVHDQTRRLFIALSGTLPRSLIDYAPSRLERVTDAEITQTLLPMLRLAERPTAAELRRDASSVVTPLLDLDDAEREYTERIQVGDFRPELLFPDDEEMTERLRRHPALLWKVENARRYAARRGSRR